MKNMNPKEFFLFWPQEGTLYKDKKRPVRCKSFLSIFPSSMTKNNAKNSCSAPRKTLER
jgi:hypothetical protein